jgi:hypothetical protein
LLLNIHFHMLFLDGVYIDRPDGSARFRWVKAPATQELTQLAHSIARRVGRFLERQGLVERDAENSYLAGDTLDEDPMNQLSGHSITYRIGVGPQAGRKVFALSAYSRPSEGRGHRKGTQAVAREPGATDGRVHLIPKTDRSIQESAPRRRGRDTVCRAVRMGL